MRGEETQVLGLLQNLPADSRRSPLLIGLPGSHSKWVRVVDGCIEHFDTFMTGEVYAVMCAHSILGRTQQPSQQFASQAFDRGVQVAQSAHGDLGVLSTLFSARTLGLTGQLSACEQADYLSGLIIGHELHALAQAQQRQINAGHQAAFSEVALIGTGALCQRYQRALGLSGFGIASLAPQATELGLWSLACAAQLVIPASEEAPHV
jgi:2-dehydro-3-deoxygalactonokinase